MKLLTTISFLISATICFAQLPPEFGINIKATTVTPSNEFRIEIARVGDNLKGIYRLRDSVSYKLDLNKEYRATNDLLAASFAKASKDSLTKLSNKLDSFRTVYSRFSVDSITIPLSEISGYVSLLTKINSTGNLELTNSSANAARNMRAGPLVEFRIRSGKDSRVVYAQSPTAATNPLLHQLIIESLKLYRERKQTGFLSKMRTNGW
jgi:hypothetical protein